MTLCVVLLTVSHHPVTFGSHGHCSRVDMIILVVGWQDSTCPHLNPPSLLISEARDMPCSHIRDISGRRHISFPMCPILVTYVRKLQKLFPVCSNTATRRKRRRTKIRRTIAKLFAWHANAIIPILVMRVQSRQEKYANNFCESVEKRRREGGRKSKKSLTA